MVRCLLAVHDSASIRGQMTHVLAKFNDVDLVITDYNMPRVDGIELIRSLRKPPNYRFAPTRVLTKESGNEMKLKGKEAGATGWIVKTLRLGETAWCH